jgi:STE24 endopeptidase
VNEDKASRYHRLARQAAVISLALAALVLGGLLLSGASRVLADAAASWAHASPGRFSPAAIALYVVLLAAVQEATAFPLRYYRGFFLEHHYGLSSETHGHWLRDHAKAAALALVIAVAGAEVVYFLLTIWPEWWWLASAAVFAAAMFGLAKLLPLVVLPIFYKFTPLDRESLRARLVSLSERAGVPVLGVYEWGLGEKTRRANAALVGTGGTRRIIVSDTLLAEYSDDEIEVILAHELAHHVHRDILTALIAESALLLASFYAAAAVLGAVWDRIGLRSPADVAGLPLLLLVGGAVSVAVTPAVNALSRWNERRADRYALALTNRPAAFISAMKRLASQNLADERPSRIVLWLFHTHPPIEQRIEAARRFGHVQL